MNANLTLSEIVTIAVVILIVFGPHRLPEMARRAGELVAKVRDAAASLRNEFTSEYEELAQPLRDIERDLKAAKDDIKASMPRLDQPEVPAEPEVGDSPPREEAATGSTPDPPAARETDGDHDALSSEEDAGTETDPM